MPDLLLQWIHQQDSKKQCSHLCRLHTPLEKCCFCRLPFGLLLERQTVDGMDTDGILNWARTAEENDQRLKAIVKRAKAAGLNGHEICKSHLRDRTYPPAKANAESTQVDGNNFEIAINIHPSIYKEGVPTYLVGVSCARNACPTSCLNQQPYSTTLQNCPINVGCKYQ